MNQFLKLVNDHSFNPIDGGAAGIGLLTLVKWLPEVSAGLSIVWVALRIYVLVRDEIFKKKEKKDGDE
jgi:hypothetical protein